MNARYRHVENAKSFEPTDRYVTLREECPVHHEADHDPPFFVLTSFDDVVGTLRDHELWRNGQGPGVFRQTGGVLGTTDEPDHSRHRRVLRSAFVPTAIERLAPRVTAFADALLDELLPLGEGDWVEDVAAPLPAMAIAELLGVGDEHRDDFHHWSADAVDALTGGDLERYGAAKSALEDVVELGADARDAVHTADTAPADVFDLLASARRAGTIDTRELRHMGYQLLVAGHETTTSLIGLMLFRLLERPELMARLRAEPDLLPGAIEEALRFDSPVHGLFRTNAEAVAVRDVTIPADSKVQVLFAAANRDPGQFDAPDEFRIDRERREVGRHVAFGWGIHFCIGAPLARLTTRIAFERLFARTTTIELAGEPVRNDSFVLHGLTQLPIRWTA
jgi:cytochrome P450